MLVIYNTLTRRKEVFTPIEPGRVGMYVCGMTVYDYCHIGHARVLVVFDVVYRHLQASGYRVDYVRNITDIDDKIINRAAERGVSTASLTREFIDAMHEDIAKLNVLDPVFEPRATDNLEPMLQIIGVLMKRGYAYQDGDGDVYYAVRRFDGYGKLSGKRLDDQIAGSRVEVDAAKRDPADFVLWKSARPGEPSWESPWGPGRPGWHIECSAMAMRFLGERFDIHGGGQDLQFPHHENEIAQSEACTGQTFVNYWMHNGFVRVDDEKMSKSLGNFFTLRDVLEHFDGEEIRVFILSSHYRSPCNYSEDNLREARAALRRLYTALRGLPRAAPCAGGEHARRLRAAMDDDFNTPDALAVLFELAREVNRLRERGSEPEAAPLGALLRALAGSLGLLQRDPEDYLAAQAGGLPAAEIEALIAEREAARAARDWAAADAIRARLQEQGVVLEDGSGATTWRRR